MHAALPLTCMSAVREGDLSDRLHQQDDGGLVCPLCKVHGELVRLGGPSGAVRERGSNVCCVRVYERMWTEWSHVSMSIVDVCKCNVERIKLRGPSA